MTARPAFLVLLLAAVPLAARHPLARPEFDTGAAHPDTPMDRMILVLEPDAERQQALEDLLSAQQDPDSPLYQQWLSPEQFGERFGAPAEDVERVVRWLEARGFTVEPPGDGRRAIVFSGTAGQVRAAFGAEIHTYSVQGERHYANAVEPRVPRELAHVVRGIASLHDFRLKPLSMLEPQYTTGSAHYLAPADFAAIYDVAPLYAAGIDGTGQSIAVVGRTNINAADVPSFRSRFGLPARNPSVIVNGADPGIVSAGELGEAMLDIEWAGAVAKNAAIQFVVSASTNTSDGVFLSAQYVVNRNLAPVVTVSFGACEAAMGAAGNAMINALWQQAAAQGITVLVSSGDSGAAGCDSPSAGTGRMAGINGLCSPQYSTCVGGTQFLDTANPAAYWSASNSGVYASAVSYIPEGVWNQSGIMPGGSQLWAGGGGVSSVYSKPAWQTAAGAWRTVPDVSLNGSTHDGYLIWMNGQMYAAGGTSASAPAMAGLAALLVQKTGGRLGNWNAKLYALAGTAAFHDITSGNNSVPGLLGASAAIGYDAATGLGSVDANQVVSRWSGAAPQPAAPTPPPAPCTYAVSPAAASFTATAANGSAGVTAGPGCSWTAKSNVSWITVSAPSGSGNGRASYAVAANTGAARTGTLTVAGKTVTVTQSSPPCTYKVGVGSTTPSAAGFGGTATVTSGAGCTWTASSSAAWLTVTSGAKGTANGTVAYGAAANSSKVARTATLTVANYSFRVTQPAASGR